MYKIYALLVMMVFSMMSSSFAKDGECAPCKYRDQYGRTYTGCCH